MTAPELICENSTLAAYADPESEREPFSAPTTGSDKMELSVDDSSRLERIIILVDLDFFYGTCPSQNVPLTVFQAKSSKFAIHAYKGYLSS
jgi:hypothetical protein